MSEFKYLGYVFSEDGRIYGDIEHRIMNGNELMAQLRLHISKKPEISKETKVMIQSSLQTDYSVWQGETG